MFSKSKEDYCYALKRGKTYESQKKEKEKDDPIIQSLMCQNENIKVKVQTLQQSKMNEELLAYIKERLDTHMIDYNYGFLLSLPMLDKIKL